MKTTISKKMQNNANTEYAGGYELWAFEKYLSNYNNDLIFKLTKNNGKSVDVLEFGAGIGTIANFWEQKTGVKPECIEIDPKQRLIIEERGFVCYENLDLIKKKYDAIYTSNVLEHIEDDQLILNKLYSKLKEGGSLIVYVPAFQLLYSELDAKFGHYRRYQKKDLLEKLRKSGFNVIKFYYADSIGFFAWLYVKLMGHAQEISGTASMEFYDKVIFPISKFLDALGCKFLFGKNILVYAEKIKADESAKI